MVTLLDQAMDHNICDSNSFSVHDVPANTTWGEDDELRNVTRKCYPQHCCSPSISLLSVDDVPVNLSIFGQIKSVRVWDEENNAPRQNAVFILDALREMDFNAVYALQTVYSCDYHTGRLWLDCFTSR